MTYSATWWRQCLAICLLCLHDGGRVEAGGGSGLLVGLARDGKLGGGADDWDIMIICMAVGAVVIFGGALVHYLYKKYKKKQADEVREADKAKQAESVGAGAVRVRPSSQNSTTVHTPPPAYNKCVADIEDE